MSEIEMRAKFEAKFGDAHPMEQLEGGPYRFWITELMWCGYVAGRLKGLEEAALAIDIGGAAPGRSFARDIRELIDKEST